MKENKSAYSCMFLVPKEIYEKLVSIIDKRDNLLLEKLNKPEPEVGNDDGAFPNLPPPPDGGGPNPPDNNGPEDPSSPSQPPPPQPFNYISSDSDDDDFQDTFGIPPQAPTGNAARVLPGNANNAPPSQPARNENTAVAGVNDWPGGSANRRLFRFVCDMCGASFQNNNDFKIHKRVHLLQMGNAVIYGNAGTPTGINLPAAGNNPTSDSLPAVYSGHYATREGYSINRAPISQNAPTLRVDVANSGPRNFPRTFQNADADDEMSDSEPDSGNFSGNCPLCMKHFKNVKNLDRHFFYCRKDKNLKKVVYTRKNTTPGTITTSSDKKSKKKFESWLTYKNKNSKAKIPQADAVSDIDSISSDGGAFEDNIPQVDAVSDMGSLSSGTISSDSDIAAFQCHFCSHTFSKKKALERHMLNMHDIDKDGNYLNPKGSKRDAASAKIKNSNPRKVLKLNKSFNCSLCSVKLKNNDQLTRHMLAKHQNQHKAGDEKSLFSCKLCNHIFSREKNLKRHLLNIHDCTPDYKSVSFQGVKRKNKDSSLQCSWCDEKFKVLFELEKHVKSKHPEVKQSGDRKYRSWV